MHRKEQQIGKMSVPRKCTVVVVEGIQLAMGMVRLPSMYDYWSINTILNAPGIVTGMGWNRFHSILSHLRLNDNSRMPQRDDPQQDKLYNVRPLMERIHLNCQASYQPCQQLAVDEAMILFKGCMQCHESVCAKETNQERLQNVVPLWLNKWLSLQHGTVITPGYGEHQRGFTIF